jgi:protoporphyrinogen oxidase
MGLAAAFHAVKAGHSVEVLEAAPEPGGMAAHFDLAGYLQRINPKLTREDVIAEHVARLRYAQPVCEPGFAAKIPPVQTPIVGVQIADTCFYYPEDRGISESVRLGREMAARLPTL